MGTHVGTGANPAATQGYVKCQRGVPSANVASDLKGRQVTSAKFVAEIKGLTGLLLSSIEKSVYLFYDPPPPHMCTFFVFLASIPGKLETCKGVRRLQLNRPWWRDQGTAI